MFMPPILPQQQGTSKEAGYMRIYRYYRENILQGSIPQHSKLPSIRALAQHMGISRNPVETAYAHLVAEGYIINKEKSGYYAAPLEGLNTRGDLHAVQNAPGEPHAAENAAGEPHEVQNAAGEPRAAQNAPDEPRAVQHAADGIYFGHDGVNMEHFPLAVWKKLTLKVLRSEGDRSLFSYGDRKGEPRLRSLIGDYLKGNRGVQCDPAQVIITSGTQQSALIISALLRSEKGGMGVEQAMHPGMYRIFQQQLLQPVPIPLEADGLSCDEENLSDALSSVYVTPSHQFPYGMILPAAKRVSLLQWAYRTNGWIIEDDYDSEFIYEGRPLPALQGMDHRGSVIYLGTFSKALAPAIRLSYLVLPPRLLARFEREFSHYDQTASRLTQKTMEAFMEGGHLDRHIRRMRKVYNESRQVLIAAVESYFCGKGIISGSSSGLHLLLSVYSAYSTEELLSRAAASKIVLDPVSKYHIAGGEDVDAAMAASSFVMGFGGLSPREIEEGVRKLAGAWLD
ncbi:PLP-dependent aminotransferase family protein [Paenibacillus oenotherae]|uniref:PLP-dependent aminotransferase family protein n=1 Tax=Paenibacillus oenotherae TaxID=1435645 RepID=A0ABS7DCJ6_9BACL|nr:PLP-dependent aminotransferase family protein [Paenibacillus oenotherae]MBW7477652.1 PLP-dependent aminotransferase family protein [Paenibacillus oenotherae]